MASEYIVVGRTDRGLVRPGNEDYLHLDDKNAVYAVCDGMGGHQAGEVASMTASETIRVLFDQFHNDLLRDDRLSPGRALPPNGDLLLRSIRLANRQIYNRAAADSSLSGMGTTVVAVALQNDLMSIAHVGDSRAYRLEERQLQPLTRDHSWVSEMQANHNLSEKDATSFVGRNVITRALGVREIVEVDYRLVKVKPGEVYILCSDGLCGFADDDEIFAVANRARSSIRQIVDDLIQLANDRGGADNVTVIVFEIKQVDASDTQEVEVFTLPGESVEELQAEDEWLARVAAFKTEQAQTQPPTRKSPGRFLLTLIFAAFILLACVFVYLQTTR